LYKKNNRWGQSVELSKRDSLFKDALQTAAESREQAISEELLKFFVDNGNHAAFAATLYTCYDLIRPDVALELSWRNKIIDFAFPYIIQYVRDLTTRVDDLEKGSTGKTKEGEILDKKKAAAPEGFQQPPSVDGGIDGMYPGFNTPLAIMPPPGVMPGIYPGQQPGYPGQPGFQQQPPPYGSQGSFTQQPPYGTQGSFTQGAVYGSPTQLGGWQGGVGF